MLRYKADVRSVLFILGLTSLTIFMFLYGWSLPTPYLAILWSFQMLWYITAGVMVHNHQHVKMWKNKALNFITDCWLTTLYGYPIFGWIPTHLQNHHMHTNGEEDYTKTYAYSEKHNLLTVLRYPSYSGGIQQRAIFGYMGKLRKNKRDKYTAHIAELVILVIYLLVFFLLDWKSALFFVFIPQQIALNSVLFFNYWQHIHADEKSEYNHSRNFTGKFLNFWLFNNGFHTVHHIKPHLHWSKTPEFHREIESEIDPRLNEKSLILFIIKQYFLSPLFPNLATKSMRTVAPSE